MLEFPPLSERRNAHVHARTHEYTQTHKGLYIFKRRNTE